MTVRRVLAGGLAYLLVYVFATTLLPRPVSATGRTGLASLFLLVPAVLALATTARAARGSRGAERVFWTLLAGGAAAYAVNVLLFALHRVWLPEVRALFALGHFGYYSYFILAVVALLVRPERPLGPQGVRAAALEWIMALVAGYFVVFYFILIPARDRSYPWFLVYTLQEALPGVLALTFALRAREEPFGRVYRLLAGGFLLAAAVGVVANWVFAYGRYEVYSPLDVDWMLAFFPMAAAALQPRSPVWVRPPLPPARRRVRLAVAAVVLPPLADLAFRALGLQPSLAAARSQLAVGTSALLAVLVALRVGPVSRRVGAAPQRALAGAGEPTDFLQFAAGAAHEVNNPLMAVTGWAELAVRRGSPRPPVEELLAAVRRVSTVVDRLQALARGGRRAGEVS